MVGSLDEGRRIWPISVAFVARLSACDKTGPSLMYCLGPRSRAAYTLSCRLAAMTMVTVALLWNADTLPYYYETR